MAAGEPAPFAGDLFPSDLSVRWAIELETCTERAAIELEHEKEKHALARARAQAHAVAGARADRQRVELLTRELEAARAWYRSPVFVAAVAATVAAAVLLSSTVLVQATAEVRK